AAAAKFDREAVDATVTRDAKGHFVVSTATYGRRLDQPAAVAAVHEILAAPDAPSDATVTVSVQPIMPSVLTSLADFAAARAEALASLQLTTFSGKDTWLITPAQVRSWISFKPGTFGSLRIEVIGT